MFAAMRRSAIADYENYVLITYIMIPNIVFAVRCRDGFENKWNNKAVEALEQVGRFGCMAFMIVNIPPLCFGWLFEGALAVYIGVDIALLIAYCLIWIICFRKNGLFRALALSIIPSVLFLFSGIMLLSVPLIVTAVIFAPCHIAISYKNAVMDM